MNSVLISMSKKFNKMFENEKKEPTSNGFRVKVSQNVITKHGQKSYGQKEVEKKTPEKHSIKIQRNIKMILYACQIQHTFHLIRWSFSFDSIGKQKKGTKKSTYTVQY